MRSRFLYVSISVLLSLIISGFLIGIAECSSQSILWTTNASGTAEIDLFSPGDTIYIKSIGPLNAYKSEYRVYVFAGNFIHEGNPDGPYPDLSSFPMPSGFSTSIVITDDNKILQLVPIWLHATIGVFTVVLDYLGSFDGYGVFHLNAQHPGYFNSQEDYRDDLCSGINLPSFNVVPEPATIALATTMVGAFASFLLIKRKMVFKK